jgi:hypothetical protein
MMLPRPTLLALAAALPLISFIVAGASCDIKKLLAQLRVRVRPGPMPVARKPAKET